jgi:hypothetical protein
MQELRDHLFEDLIKFKNMKRFSYSAVEWNSEGQASFLSNQFPVLLNEAGGKEWFLAQDSYVRDQFVKDCIDKHNALSPGASLQENLEGDKSLNQQLLEAIRYQNKVMTEMLEELKKEA